MQGHLVPILGSPQISQLRNNPANEYHQRTQGPLIEQQHFASQYQQSHRIGARNSLGQPQSYNQQQHNMIPPRPSAKKQSYNNDGTSTPYEQMKQQLRQLPKPNSNAVKEVPEATAEDIDCSEVYLDPMTDGDTNRTSIQHVSD